jgi:hypothetical protein
MALIVAEVACTATPLEFLSRRTDFPISLINASWLARLQDLSMVSRRLYVTLGSLALLAGVCLAGPLPAYRSLDLWEKRQEQCNYLLNDDEASQRAIWDSSGLGVGQFLDNWLTKNGEDDWLNRMDEDLYTVGESNMRCITLGGTDCEAPTQDECRKWHLTKGKKATTNRNEVRYAQAGVPQLFWILRASQIHFGLASAYHLEFSTETINNTLSVPKSMYGSQIRPQSRCHESSRITD